MERFAHVILTTRVCVYAVRIRTEYLCLVRYIEWRTMESKGK